MNGLTKKQVHVDRNLSAVLGVDEGAVVSYAEIQKGLHKYIKDNDLRNPQWKPKANGVPPSVEEAAGAEKSTGLEQMKRCRDCGAEIPNEAVFCDLCGVSL